MARDRRDRERRGRAAERARAERQTRLIYIGAGTVLVLAALVIGTGISVTSYLPPRAHVVTVAGNSYQAREVADRGAYLAFFEGGAASISDIARDTVDKIVEEEALRALGAETVGLVTPEDVEHEVLIGLGLIADDSLAAVDGGDATPAPEATMAPTAEPTPEPTVDPQEFADAYTAFLRDAALDREEYEAIVEARLYRERLNDLFEEQVGTSGAQVRLQRIRVSTELASETVLAELAGGADFATLADEQSVATEDGLGGEIGWTVSELQPPDVVAATEGLEAGEWSQAIETVGLFFEIYRLAEVAEDRAYEPAVQAQLTAQRFDDWLANAIASLEVDRDLSQDEETWINERVVADVTSRLGG